VFDGYVAQRDIAPLKARIAAGPELGGKTIIQGIYRRRSGNRASRQRRFRTDIPQRHNWMRAGTADAAVHAFYKALKPGGILGLEEHLGRPGQPQDPQARSGYLRQDYAIALTEKAGFKLAGPSEVNANPKDTKDYPEGVWDLAAHLPAEGPGQGEIFGDRQSDRFVLKFAKPAEAK
jgi:predicted methyltransferase